jgi:hypothetical protein
MSFDVKKFPDATAKNPIEIQDGEWFTIMKDGDKPGLWGCCDCGLMHRTEFKIEDGEIYIRVRKDLEATRIRRDAMWEEQR